MAITELRYLMESREKTLSIGFDLLKDNKDLILDHLICLQLMDILTLDPEDQLGLEPYNCVEGFWKWLEKASPPLYGKYQSSVRLME